MYVCVCACVRVRMRTRVCPILFVMSIMIFYMSSHNQTLKK